MATKEQLKENQDFLKSALIQTDFEDLYKNLIQNNLIITYCKRKPKRVVEHFIIYAQEIIYIIRIDKDFNDILAYRRCLNKQYNKNYSFGFSYSALNKQEKVVINEKNNYIDVVLAKKLFKVLNAEYFKKREVNSNLPEGILSKETNENLNKITAKIEGMFVVQDIKINTKNKIKLNKI